MNIPAEVFKIDDLDCYSNVSLAKYTTIRLEAKGSIVIVKSIDALKSLVKVLKDHDCKYHLVGWGANQIILNSQETIFIKLNFSFDRNYLKQVRDEYRLPASVSLNILTSHAQKFGLKGWEVFTGIPASVAGAVFMNAGTGLGEIGELVKEVTILRNNLSIETLNKDQLEFSYRKNHFVNDGDIIVEVVLTHQGIDSQISQKIKDYLTFRKSSQPITTKNCGCVFKNFDSNHRAGHFIDLLGLKGLTLNGLTVSHMHGNFIENQQDATSTDFCNLVALIQDELELQTGIRFELEAKVY